MKKLLLFFCLIPLMSFAQQVDSKIIKGIVKDNSAPMANVAITTSATQNAVYTDNEGKYSIKAVSGETLTFSYTGMEPVEIMVEDVTRILNITMYPKIEQLEEVTVTKSGRKSQEDLQKEYATNKRLIKTAYGILDADRAPGRIMMLNENDIMPIGICILDVVRNEFPGVIVNGDCFNGGDIIIRGVGSISFDAAAIYDIDGQIFTNTPIWVDVNNIKRLAILNNFATATKYGGLASGGVVVINTVSGTQYPKTLVDQARLRNNFYDNGAVSQQSLMKNAPEYLKELHASTTDDAAETVFGNYLSKYSGSYYFLVDSYRFFMERGNETFAEALIWENFGRFNDNPVALKSLAYVHDSFEEYGKANELYKEVFISRPHYAQSYLDLAKSYRQIGDYQKAIGLYSRYAYLLENGFMSDERGEFTGLMDRELNNLIALKGGDLMSKKNLRKYALEDDFKGTRLVFEWADGEAEFDLQFVNPKNQYFKWQHSLKDDADRIRDEKKVGYSVTEYLIDDSLPGTWKVNLNYLGNKSLTPTYLKATVYHNYGSASQRMETKVFKLSTRDVNQELFTLRIASGIVSR